MTTFTTPPTAGQRYRGSVSTALWSEVQIFHRDRQTLSASAATVSFTVPSGLRTLRLTWSARADNAVIAQVIYLQVGGDVGTNYHYTYTQTNNTTVTGVSTHGDTKAAAGVLSGSSDPAAVFASGVVDFPSWDSVAATNLLGYVFNSQMMGSAVANQYVIAGGGQYAGSNARTTLTVLPQAGNFVAGSDFQVYGLTTT